MTDRFEQTDADDTPEQINDALLRDLRSLPSISAPLDFQLHLKRKIAEIETSARLPWWQRFFKPVREGGFPIPAYAYGAVAMVAVLAVSVYVYRATDVEQTLREEKVIQPESSLQTTPESIPEAPKAVESQRINENMKPAPPTLPKEKSTISAPSKKLRSVQAPPAAPAAKEESEGTESFELIFKTRGVMNDQTEMFDSTRTDSLRRADSLRQYKLQSPPSKDPDPR